MFGDVMIELNRVAVALIIGVERDWLISLMMGGVPEVHEDHIPFDVERGDELVLQAREQALDVWESME
jgi:hypothetical protein